MEEFLFKRKLMGGEIEFRLYDTPELIGEEIALIAYVQGKRLEKIFSFYDKESELAKLNKKRKSKVSQELLEVIKKALEFCEKTEGKYDISKGKNFLERKNGKQITKLNCSYRNININGNEVELTNKDVLIDLGSIAKGYVVDKLCEFIKTSGVESALVNARGDLRIFGNVEETVELQHPRNKEERITKFKLKNAAVATSGDYNQYFENYDNSHIVGKKEIISASVIAQKLVEADAFATCVMVLDKEKREKLIKAFKQYKLLLIDNQLNIKKYNF